MNFNLIMENWRRFVEQSEKEKKVASRAGIRRQDIKNRNLGRKDKDQFAYVFGTVDGQKLEAQNENNSFYGASMPKPILLLVAQQVGEPVSDDMIKGLLNYVGSGENDSNAVFRKLSKRKVSKHTKKYAHDKGIAGDIASAEFPEDRVIDTLDEGGDSTRIIPEDGKDYSKLKINFVNSWTRNKQTPLEFFNFLVFLKKNDFAVSHPDKEVQQIQKVLSVMKRTYFGEDMQSDRELKGFKAIEKAMRSAGLPVNKVYGKGGKDAGVLNYGIIIDDQYIMCIYTDMSRKHSSRDANRDAHTRIRKFVNQKIIDVYKSATGISQDEYQKMQPDAPIASRFDEAKGDNLVAKEKEFQITGDEKITSDLSAPDGMEKYENKAGLDLWRVKYGELQGIEETAPAILEKDTAEKFIKLIEVWNGAPLQLRFKSSAPRPTFDEPGRKGRSKTSQHKFGKAIDFKPPVGSKDPRHLKWKEDLLTAAMSVGFTAFGFGEGSMHVDTRSKGWRWWVYTSQGVRQIYKYNYSRIIPYAHPKFSQLCPRGHQRQLGKVATLLKRRKKIA